MDKKIFEKLSVQELKEEIDEDTIFQHVYKYVQEVNDSILKSELDKVKWSDLTYRRLYKYSKFLYDTAYFNELRDESNREWQVRFGNYDSQVDSISKHWKGQKLANSLERFVKVELATIEREYYSYVGGVKSVNLGFKLTPANEKVDQLRFSYRIEAKIDEENNSADSYTKISSLLNRAYCRLTTPLTKSAIHYWEADYQNERAIGTRNIAEFLRDFNIYIDLTEVRVNGINRSNDELGIPESVQHYWDYENKEVMRSIYFKDIVNEFLNKDYVEKYEYLLIKYDSAMKKKDSLSYAYFRLQDSKRD